MKKKRNIELKGNVDGNGLIKIPDVLRKKYNLVKGTELFFVDTGKGIEIRTKREALKLLDSLYVVGGVGTSYQWDGVSYLLKGSRRSFLVDCGTNHGFPYIVQNIQKFGVIPREINNIILTHCHFDHAAGGYLFKEKFETKILINELGKKPVERGESYRTASYIFGESFPSYTIDETFKEGETLILDNIELLVIDLPGHCPDNTGLYGKIDGKNVCFIGDICGGHSSNWLSSEDETKKSVEKLQNLDIDILCHGHTFFTKKEKIPAVLQTWWYQAEDRWFGYMLSRHRTFG